MTPVLAFGASRVTVFVAMWLAYRAVPGSSFLGLAKRWDGVWYYLVATTGYPRHVPVVDGSAAKSTMGFFPLFPMAARLLARLPGLGALDAEVGISFLGGLVATVLVWRLADAIWDRSMADRSAVLFAFFPASFVFSIAYSEGLALALSAGCLLLLYRQRWLLAGALGALATATRPNALALVPAAAVAGFLVIRSERRWSALVAPALAPMGFVAFHVFLRLHTGQWDAYVRTQAEGWGQEVSPLATVNLFRKFLGHPFTDVNITIYVAGTLLGLAGFVLLVRARPPLALLAYAATILVLSLSSYGFGASPRFLLTAFPLLYGLAHAVRREHFSVAVGTEAAILGTLTFFTMTTLLATP